MRTVPLGNTGQEVSALCLGTMLFGSRIDEHTSQRLLDMYVEAGGGFLDTANAYARWVPGCKGGESEQLLGRWMRQRGNRKGLFIATKVGFEYPGVERGLRAEQIRQECDKSLQRLGIETIDLYYAHVDDRRTGLAETIEAFDGLVKAGKVRLVGASNYAAWRLEEARWVSRGSGWAEFCCVQQRHSYVRPKPGASFEPQLAANDDLLDYCRASGTTLLAYSPLLKGAYDRPDRELPRQYQGRDTDERLAVLTNLARDCHAARGQVVLAWMLAGDPPAIPVFSASTVEQMEEDLAALDIKLKHEDVQRLNAASG